MSSRAGRSAMSATTSSSLAARSGTGRMSVRRNLRKWLRKPVRRAVPMVPAAPVIITRSVSGLIMLSRELRHDVRRQQFERFGVVLVGAADQELDAGIAIAADQVGDLRDRAGYAVVVLRHREQAALGGQ